MPQEKGSGRRKRHRGRCLLLAAALAALPATAFAAGPLAGETIVIDPGHGGRDGGATAYGRVEKSVTLPIGLDLSALLRGAGAHVVLTRSSDRFISLAARVALANAGGGDIFVSIHANALSDPGFAGVTTFYGASSGFVTGVTRPPALVAASRALAGDVERSVHSQTGEIDRGIQPADYYVLGNRHMPTILVETGYITNPTEGQHLTDPGYQETLAAGIAGGLAKFADNPDRAAPTGDPGPAPTTPGAAYVVRPGDTLSAIAVRYGTTEAALRLANALPDTGRILAGQTLSIAFGSRAPASATDSPPPYMAADVTGPSAGRSYVVQDGDTLFGIAKRTGTSVAALALANQIQNTDHLVAGATLHLPESHQVEAGTASPPVAAAGTERYRIRSGDTLSAIALRLGISERALVTANQLADRDHLVAGRYLRIPASD